MKTLALAWRYLWSRPLGAALNVLLLSLGLASISFSAAGQPPAQPRV